MLQAPDSSLTFCDEGDTMEKLVLDACCIHGDTLHCCKIFQQIQNTVLNRCDIICSQQQEGAQIVLINKCQTSW